MRDRVEGRLAPIVQLGLIGLALLVLTTAALFLFGRLGDNFFIVLALLCGALTIVAVRVAEACPERPALLLILVMALLIRLPLIAADPMLSDDVFRYVWDGRVQAAGVNPYRYVPAASELEALRDEAVYPFINRKEYAVTIYPPAAQMFFYGVTRLHDSVSMMKVTLVACEGVTVLALVALLRRLGRPATRVVAYAWHPLALWEVANNGHIDGAMVALATLALWLFASGRTLAAGAAAAVGALFKPFALLVLPGLWRPWDWRLPLVVAAVGAALYGPYLSVGTGVLGFLPGYVAEEKLDSGSAFWILKVLQGAFGPWTGWRTIYVVIAGGLILALALRAGFRTERPLAVTIDDINRLLLAFLFLLSPDYPWYFLMAVPFLALNGSWPGWAMTVGGFVLYDVLPWDPQIHFTLRDAAFNLAVLAATIWAAWSARRSGSDPGSVRRDDRRS